jgi:hypothetical protein
MKIKMPKFLFLIFISYLLLPNLSFSQSNSSINKTFVVLEAKEGLSQSDIEKIEKTNYDEYRFYSIRKKVQLERGPLIELLSIKELEALGVSVSQSIVAVAKSKSESFKHESILNLNIGVGIIYLKIIE